MPRPEPAETLWLQRDRFGPPEQQSARKQTNQRKNYRAHQINMNEWIERNPSFLSGSVIPHSKGGPGMCTLMYAQGKQEHHILGELFQNLLLLQNSQLSPK